jgi:hypothetical protein
MYSLLFHNSISIIILSYTTYYYYQPFLSGAYHFDYEPVDMTSESLQLYRRYFGGKENRDRKIGLTYIREGKTPLIQRSTYLGLH